ncbi:hypothetical protein, variant 4 [Aphanomyces astaci]|uniref:RING-type domain-containing protein n=1 Tax=Aphanomyces astaci TaxID=112090 RepID=W4HCM6_APHAT|nr:hypothetical protein, variant 3 [Aphanomyces astaci]XP_009822063.1 hypothetical protein, variant 4 [Aphanomyces astaci]ETV89662.1 hypothetical protein, variant 3 [Aphanomyces astaci]ETV89663.1 hypothetical protein, variant 4 [Aphanomyces astaci]|eukprot:XP_009822062.1 hypothetical protein, variant 3 [Aphanomyces astaci]
MTDTSDWCQLQLAIATTDGCTNSSSAQGNDIRAAVVSFAGTTQEGEAYTDIAVSVGDQPMQIPSSWGAFRPNELHAMAFLNEKKCLSMEIRSAHVCVGIHIPTYSAMSGSDKVNPSTPICKHMAIFMRWFIKHSRDEWSYPYMSELVDAPTDSTPFLSSALYQVVPPIPSSAAGDAFTPSPNLLPTLRRYQKAAIAWMLERERPPHVPSGPPPPFSIVEAVRAKSGVTYNPFTCHFSTAAIHGSAPPWSGVRGGILADEMGLGKTVQVLACILSHPSPAMDHVHAVEPSRLPRRAAANLVERSCVCNCPDDDVHGWIECTRCRVWQHRLCTGFQLSLDQPFYCEGCLRHVDPDWAIPSTLIISPESIHKQWEREILRHTRPDSLSIMTYGGIKALRQRLKGRPSAQWKYCRAPELAKFDVVLTTYEALRDDLHHVSDASSSCLRRRKRYRIVASPLTHVTWWRICMDEAQLVENTQAKASLMALALKSTLRWCVSGTPFSTDLWEVYGTLAFLQVQPPCFQDKAWWRAVMGRFASSSPRLGEVVQGLMWRNEKKDVVEQINLPPQTVETSWLRLSEIETHFYNQQMDECTKHRKPTDSNEITVAMFNSLLRLRQACCHPQVGSHGLRALDENRPMSMDDVLTEMMLKAQRECEEAQRVLLAALNGLAALNVVEGAVETAVGLYFEALSLIQHNWAEFRADLLPRLHLVHNFGRLLERFGAPRPPIMLSQVPFEDAKTNHCLPLLTAVKCLFEHFSKNDRPTDSFELLRQARLDLHHSATQIEAFYLSQCNLTHDTALHKYETAYRSLQAEHFPQVDAPESPHLPDSFHAAWMECLLAVDDPDALVDRVRAKLMSRSDLGMNLSQRIRSVVSLRVVLLHELDRLFGLRAENHTQLMALSRHAPTKHDVYASGNCAFCREGRDGPKCQHCLVQPDMDTLGAMLGITSDTTPSSATNYNLGSLLLDIVGEVAKNATHGIPDMHQQLQTVLGDVRKERVLGVKLWKAQHARLGALDELEMAKTTMQLREPDDPVRDVEKTYKLVAVEVPVKRMELEQERAESSANLASKLSPLRYLLHLHRTKQQHLVVDECAVCHDRMPAQRRMWPCAHVFCLSCTAHLIKQPSALRCPTCRTPTTERHILLVNDIHPQRPYDARHLGGTGLGTKVDSIVNRVLSLEAGAKCLLFSQWPDMLRLLHQALTSAGVRCLVVAHKKDFDATLHQFKHHPAECVLAMPFKYGANGVNIVEATHVILVEPLLTPGVEAQAINRVHRIGQDKPTTVHKFVVHNSVEEGILVLQHQKQRDYCAKKHDKETMTWTDWTMLLQLVRDQLAAKGRSKL